jgi:hypothetical protein
MIYKKLTGIIEQKRDDILKLWLDEFKRTKTLRIADGFDEAKMKKLMEEVLAGFDDVISQDVSKYRICLDFTHLGSDFFKDKFAIHDILNALSLLKKAIMEVVSEEDFFSSAFELYRLQELNNKAGLYFDRAMYYAALGYEEHLKEVMQDKGVVGNLKKFFGSSDARKKHIETCALELEE